MSFLLKIKNTLLQSLRHTNKLLVLFCALASAYGVVLVYSAALSLNYVGSRSVIMQAGASILGIIIAIVISKFDYENICNLWPVWAVISFVLVLLTYTPLGLNVSGTDDTAWLSVPFIGTFQPAELMKIAFIITFAKHLASVQEKINHPLTLLLLLLHGGVPVLMVLKQGDDGTALVFICIMVAMLFAAGIHPAYVLSASGLAALAIPFAWNMLDETKKERFLCLIDVEKYLLDRGWQQYLGLTALGSGQLWGVGYLQGGQHQLYARNNDFIFTVAGEEFGFIGAILLLVILTLITILIFRDAIHARDRLGMFLCIGMMAMIGFQSIINIGMTLRLLPVIGITLPFFSAGGSSAFTLYLGIGLVLSVHYSSSRSKNPNALFYKKR